MVQPQSGQLSVHSEITPETLASHSTYPAETQGSRLLVQPSDPARTWRSRSRAKEPEAAADRAGMFYQCGAASAFDQNIKGEVCFLAYGLLKSGLYRFWLVLAEFSLRRGGLELVESQLSYDFLFVWVAANSGSLEVKMSDGLPRGRQRILNTQ